MITKLNKKKIIMNHIITLCDYIHPKPETTESATVGEEDKKSDGMND